MNNILLLVLFFGLSCFSFQTPTSFSNLPVQSNCKNVPELNQKVLDFAKTRQKKKVGNGECWTLAAEALKSVGAKWDGMYRFGNEVDYQKDCIFPGDIVQFEDIYLKYEKNGEKWEEDMSHHTAIIYEVKGTGVYTLIHQNNWQTGKKVGITDFDAKNITKGTFQVFRPTK